MSDQVPAWVEEYLLADYAPGGRGPHHFDCAGLVLDVLSARHGVDVLDVDHPGEAHEAAAEARSELISGRLAGCDVVPVEKAQAGDVLLIAPGRYPTHVGIVVARGRFLHALEGAGVAVERINGRPWRRRIVSVHRPRRDGPVAVGEVGSVAGPIIGAFQSIYSTVSTLRTAATLLPTGSAVAALDYLRSSLFPPISRPDGDIHTPGRRDVSGFSNEMRPFASVPVHFGTLRFFPDLGALPYYSLSGDALYQHHLFVLARNKVNVSSVKNGDTPILSDSAVAYTGKIEGDGDLDGIEFEIRQDFDPSSTTDSTRLRLYPGRVDEEPVNITLRRGASGGNAHWVSRRTPPKTTRIEVQIEFPQGLYGLSKEGKLGVARVRVVAEYRSIDSSGSWTQFDNRLFKAKDRNVIRRALEVDVDEGQYDVRVRRITGFISGYAQVGDVTQWTLLRSYGDGLPVALSGCTVMAVRVKHSNNLSGRLATLNCVGASVMPDWNGATWASAATSNPASHIRYVLQGTAGRRTIADGRIDLTQLAAFHERCDDAGFELNTRIVERTVAHDLLERIANVGRASYSVIDGLHTVVIDDPDDTTPVQVFTSRNVVAGSFTGQMTYLDELHAVKVRFKNRDLDWADDERIVYNDGYSASNATEFETLDGWGITDPDQAYTYGRWFLAIAELRRERFTMVVDFEHLRCVRGSPVRVAHPNALIGGAAGRIKSVTLDGSSNVTAIEVDNVCVMESGKTYEVRVRAADGDIVRSAVSTVVGENYSLTLSSPFAASVGVAVGDLYIFGEFDSGTGLENSMLCRVASVRPAAGLTATLTLEPLAAAAHDADTGTIPNYNPQVQVPPSGRPTAPPTVVVRLGNSGSTTRTLMRRKAARAKIRVRARVSGVSA